jgi:putative transposase
LVAKCVNASLGRWENFWASEPVSYVRLLDDEAVIDKLAYLLTNPVKAGLVEDGAEWPGLRLGRPGSYPVRRPDIFFRKEGEMPKSLRRDLAPPPGLAGRQAQKRIDEAVAEREREVRARIRREGRRFLGVRAVARQNPFDSPHTLEPRRGLSPRIASRNKWLRIETLTRCAEFVRDHAEALARWLEGKRTVVFPLGTYLMRIRHGARCAEA